ncbi:MAG TPA: TIGR03621 family F420-dependent LLM class oxidoreductase [Acidimicrobiales bacterium]|nr:TIGR03621 family F420-dependent LLM class oxidoreductase [Acidimicrobiales bacterium]
MARPFRFAVQLNGAADGPGWRSLARRCEALGYATLFIPDHFGDQWGPLVALTVAAEATTTLRVGTLVLDNDYRHPVVLAKELATLDLVSEGRLEVGIGAGWMTSDYDESGIPLDPPGVRVDRLTEALDVFDALWSEGSATLGGAHYKVTAAQGLPRPHTKPRPPLIIGGGSPRVLRLAARRADIVGVNPNLRSGRIGPETSAECLPDKFDQRIAWVREAAGDRIASLDLQCLTFMVQVGVDRRQVASEMAPLFGVTPEDALEIPLALVGSVDEICDTLEERRRRWGFNYIVVHEPEMEAFAPVVERLAGR